MNIFLDKVEINNEIEKLNMYMKTENLNISSMNKIFNKETNDYISNNQKKLNEIEFEMLNKLNLINNIHKNYIDILKYNLEKYEITAKKVVRIFEDIL